MENVKYEIDTQWLETRLHVFQAARQRVLKAWITRQQAVIAKLNSGVAPTVGRNHKGEFTGFHAPQDGYIHEWLEGEKTLRKQFMGGQFLPIDKNEDSMFEGSLGAVKTHKFTYVPVANVEKAIEAIDAVTLRVNAHGPYSKGVHTALSAGKHFEDRDGNYVCFAYLSNATDDVAEHVENALLGEIKAARAVEEAKRQAVLEAAEPCPTGKVEISGIVLTTKWQESMYGSTLKMLVQDDRGFKVWGSVPSKLENVKGRSVSFSATVQPSEDDEKFGFFKRPTKATFNEGEVA